MGMYDNVIMPCQMNCLFCGEELTDWQTKDGPRQCEDILWHECANFYTACWCCQDEDEAWWYEWKRKSEGKYPIDWTNHYVLSVHKARRFNT